MHNNKIWLSSPHMSGNEITFVEKAFQDNWVAPLGPHVNEFERLLAVKTEVGHAAALSSGTAALHLALMVLGVQHGDEVICQTFTFAASANPIKYVGANPVFVDSEQDTWNMDPVLLEEAIIDGIRRGKKPTAIIVVHLYGMPAKMESITDISQKYEIPIIEDAAEALGSSIGNMACGSFGKLAVLSFNGNKIITTSGGGALVGKNEDMIERARYLASQAREPAVHYHHTEIGYNYRMSNLLAGVGIAQLAVLEDRVKARRNNHERYRTYFSKWQEHGFEFIFQPEPENYFSNRWLTCILVDPLKNRGLDKDILQHELKKANIESRPLWKPMHMQPVFNDALFFENGVSERLFNQGLCLPSGSNLTENDFERIFSVFDMIIENFYKS